MKLRPFRAIVVTALAVLLPTSLAWAADTTYTDGDIFLGFRATGGTGATLDYLVNLGPATQFLNATGPITLNTGNIAADLSSSGLFGSSWYTRSDLFYSLIGGTSIGAPGDPPNTVYTSDQDDQPFTRGSNSAQSLTTTKISTLGNTFSDNTSSPNATNGLTQQASDSNSYASFQPNGPNSQGSSFGAFNPTNELNPANVAYLDRLTPANQAAGKVLLGTVALSNAGVVTFTPVPEPSSIVILSLGLSTCALGRFRRRAQASQS